MINNIDIRFMIDDAGLKHKDIAKQIGITNTSFSRIMRYELSPENRLRIIKAIQTLKGREE